MNNTTVRIRQYLANWQTNLSNVLKILLQQLDVGDINLSYKYFVFYRCNWICLICRYWHICYIFMYYNLTYLLSYLTYILHFDIFARYNCSCIWLIWYIFRSNIFPANHLNFLICLVYSAERFPFTFTKPILI